MSRRRIVSREDALQAALEQFWAKGYNATTIDDLQAAMGIQRGSFYLHYKDKRTLFFLVLDRYRETVVEKRRQLIRDSKSPMKGIRKFFKTLIEHSLTNLSRSGCLNTNSATELGVTDKEISKRLGIGMKNWADFWIETLTRAKAEGELRDGLDLKSAANLLVAISQGINVISKVNPDKKFLESVVRSALAGMESLESVESFDRS